MLRRGRSSLLPPLALLALLVGAFTPVGRAEASPPDDTPSTRALSHRAEAALDEAPGRWAVVIGVDRYDDDRIVDLQFPAADAHSMAEILIGGGAFLPEHVVVMTPDAAPELRPTRNNILRELERLNQAGEADLVAFYYSGHGLGAGDEASRQNYLLPMDADLDVAADSALSVDRVLQTLDRLPARQRLIVFDACRNQVRTDAKGALPAAWAAPRYQEAAGTQVLYCTRFGEVSYEDPESGHGACTGVLLEALAGKADGQAGDPPDEVVGAKEVRAYLEDRLPRRDFGGPPQVPYGGGEWTGDFALTAARLPPSPAGVPRGGQPVDDRQLRAGVAIALDAWRAGDRLRFLSARRDLVDALAFASEPLSEETAASFHRMQFLYRAEVHDASGAIAALRAVAAIVPGQPPLAGLEPVPPGYEATDLWAPDEGRPEDLPRRVELRVDGRTARRRPTLRPALVQAVNCDGSVQWTAWLAPSAPLPSVNVGVDCGPSAARYLAIGAGTALVTSGALLAGGMVERGAFYEALAGRDPDALSAAVEAEAAGHEQRANALGYAAQAAAALGLGVGLGWLVVRF